MLDGNFPGFQEHKESLNVNDSLKSNGWNLEPKFNTCFCDIEIGGCSARNTLVSQPTNGNTGIRESVIQEETEEEVESHNKAFNNVVTDNNPNKQLKGKGGFIEKSKIGHIYTVYICVIRQGKIEVYQNTISQFFS